MTDAIRSVDLVIAAAPLGWRCASPVPPWFSVFRAGQTLYGLNCREHSPLQCLVRQSGVSPDDGRCLLAFQAAHTFRYLLSRDLPHEMAQEWLSASVSVPNSRQFVHLRDGTFPPTSAAEN